MPCLSLRLFIAVDLEEASRSALMQRVTGLVANLNARGPVWRPVRAESLHLTLKFLGQVERSRIGDLTAAMAEASAAHAAFPLVLRGVGAFPKSARASVVWVGAETGAAELTALAADVDAACARIGFAPEARPFQPHVTVARPVKRDRSAPVAGALATWPDTALPVSIVQEIVLYSSEARGGGSVYSPIATVPLRSPT